MNQTITKDIKSTKTVNETAEIIQNGGVAIIPSESSYGISCDATNSKAVEKVISIKERSQSKGLIILISDLKMAQENFTLSRTAKRLIEGMPFEKTLTLVADLKQRSKISKLCNKPDKTQAFRIPGNEFAQKLIEKLNKPIISTSANLNGKEAIYEFDKIENEFKGKVDLILNAKNLDKKLPSTIYNTKNSKIERIGTMSEKELQKLIAQANF